MAYLAEISWKCRECGIKPAVVELLGQRNQTFGKFCQKCGDKRLKQQLKYEAEERADRI